MYAIYPQPPKKDRNEELVRLRDEGWLFRELGEKYDISTNRAIQLYWRAKRSEEARARRAEK